MEVLRSDHAVDDTWDLSPMYASLEEWEKSFQEESLRDYEKITLPFKEADPLTPELLKDLFDTFFSIDKNLRSLYTWAHLYFDQDTKNDIAKQILQRITIRCHTCAEAFSWIEPKVISQPSSRIKEYIQSPVLEPYRTTIERLVRLKEHTLPESEESILAASQRAISTSHRAFSALNDADFTFSDVEDSQKNKHSLTHGSYQVLLKDSDRILRMNAFQTLHKKYGEFENTFAELIDGTAQHHFFTARTRKYSSCLEATLWPKEIQPSVYKTLIETVRKNIEPLRRYMTLRKKMLKVDSLQPWDLYIPLMKESTSHYSYDEAVALILESCKPLGKEYVDILREGLTKSRWVDRYENQNKRSGAYSSGCYGSFPYILMNYKGTLRDVFTLAHEAGHSMHSYLSHKHQPFHYSDYEIFVAEVASTFNEELLTQELLRRAQNNPSEQAIILNQKLEDIRGTLFRQTLFAEFELFIHEQAEKGLPITPAILKEKYIELNKFYYGEELCTDNELSAEWARIPHFYYNFYVYQYATGISAALALNNIVIHGSDKEREAYLNFLKGGGSLFPIELLQKAGVDMRSSLPVEATIHRFSEILDAFESLST